MILYGTNPIAWSNDDDHTLGGDISLDQCLSEAAEIGFAGIEKGHKMPTEPETLRAVLGRHGLRLVSGWHSLQLLGHGIDGEKQAIQPHLELLKAQGCHVCIACETSGSVHGIANVPMTNRPQLPAAEWESFARGVEEIAAYCKTQHIDLAYHHHMGTVVQTGAEIDQLMAKTGPATGLLLDTGHACLAGADPVDLARRHMHRIRHIHCKNVRQKIMELARKEDMSYLAAVRAGIFTVPGDPEGNVDFASVLAAAVDHDYSGWLVIEAEQDPDIYPPTEYQSLGLRSLRALAREVGLD